MTRLQVEHPFATDRLNGPDDYRVEWDVPSLGKAFTDSLSRAIDSVRARPAPDPERAREVQLHGAARHVPDLLDREREGDVGDRGPLHPVCEGCDEGQRHHEEERVHHGAERTRLAEG